ncbi:hypothetical protein Rleg2_4244 [Rhizobium leguminosarum bv. trifolii WSM2304]|uniref:Uncharacterized protein n=1 Tax=Rhizobium leguminosarum bv. trifolii (strain WSM2304) TaxID=395492 RepID=A0ABF7QTA5_RHILW|nr:hypothetical protein Rleg2_4244 [Rhizobium leguminosarum bv. trifolii WSM2304]
MVSYTPRASLLKRTLKHGETHLAAPIVPPLRTPCAREALLKQLLADLFAGRSIDVYKRPVRSCCRPLRSIQPASAFHPKALSALPWRLAPACVPFRHFAWLPISGASIPDTSGTPSPSSRISCPSHRTVSPSTAVREAQMSIDVDERPMRRRPVQRATPLTRKPFSASTCFKRAAQRYLNGPRCKDLLSDDSSDPIVNTA